MQKIAEDNNVGMDVVRLYRVYLEKVYQKNILAQMGKTTFKDSRQSKTYEAEAIFNHVHGRGKLFTIDEAQSFVEKVFNSWIWQECQRKTSVSPKAPRVEFIPHFGKSVFDTTVAMAYFDKIVTTQRGLNEYIMLHELAHCNGHRNHDVMFRITLVKFVSEFMSYELGKELERAFKQVGLTMRQAKEKDAKPFDKWYAGYLRAQVARKGKK